MIGWMIRQMMLLLLGFALLIIGMRFTERDGSCLCISLLVEHRTHSELRIIDIETGAIYSVVADPYLGQSALTHDRRLAQYTYNNNTITFSSDDTGLFIGRYPSWSPDGQLLAYIPPTREENYISLFDVQSEQHTTVEAAYPNSELVWSSDSARVVYSVLYSFPVSNAVQVYEVHVLDVEAHQSGRLFTADHAVAALNWSGDNQIVYVLTSNRDLIALDANTGEIQSQRNIEADLSKYDNATNTRISANAEWLMFVENSRSLIAINLHDGRVAQSDLDIVRVINALWWE